MSIKYQPATDEQISDMPARWVAPREFGGGIDLDDGFSLLSRIEADREERDRLKALVERLKPNQQLYPCANCGKLRTKAEGGAVFTVCDSCWNGTGRAR